MAATITQAQTVDGILDIQRAVCQAVLKNDFFARSRIQVIPEDALDVVTGIRTAVGRLGIVGVVMTPDLSYQGRSPDGHPVWKLEEIQVAFIETPVTNRGRANASTALDAALVAAETLHEEGLLLKGIRQAEEEGHVVATVSCTASALFRYARTDKPAATPGSTVNEPATP